jgi:hypothetical protein
MEEMPEERRRQLVEEIREAYEKLKEIPFRPGDGKTKNNPGPRSPK